jgi:hypothetical protein
MELSFWMFSLSSFKALEEGLTCFGELVLGLFFPPLVGGILLLLFGGVLVKL